MWTQRHKKDQRSEISTNGLRSRISEGPRAFVGSALSECPFLVFIGDVYCPKTKCSVKLCLHKKTFQNIGRSDYQNLRGASVCQVRIIPFEDQTNSFFLAFGQGVYVFAESQNQFKMSLKISIVLASIVPTEKCESLGGYVKTLRTIYTCGSWLFVDRVPFMLQEHVKTTKTDTTCFFFAKRRWTCYPTNNFYLMSLLNQRSIERKIWVWATKYNRLLEMCVVQFVILKRAFIFEPIKRLDTTTVKSAKPAATFWIFLLYTRNRNLCCLAVMVHIVLQERRVAATKKKNHLHFWRNFSANHNQADPNLNQKRPKLFHLWHIDTPLVDTVNQNFIYVLILYTFSLH